MTTENTPAKRSNGPLGFLWFLAVLGMVAGFIMLLATDAEAAGLAAIGIGFQAMLFALAVQAVRHRY